jgi:tRNA-dihydrouridine synthase B
MNQLESCEAQVEALNQWFGSLAEQHERLPYLPLAETAANDDNDPTEEATTRRLLA